jgi:hypothetical protein
LSELDGDLVPRDRARGLGGSFEADREPRQARDLPAIDADEVRVILGVLDPARAPPQLEAPHVVAEVGARQDSDVGEIHQDAVDRRAVEPAVPERVEELGVAVGAGVGVDVLEHGHARGRAAEARRAKQ